MKNGLDIEDRMDDLKASHVDFEDRLLELKRSQVEMNVDVAELKIDVKALSKETRTQTGSLRWLKYATPIAIAVSGIISSLIHAFAHR